MSRTHVPVLAGELIDVTDPAPGETVVDCTFGAGGHARLLADRIGPAGTLVCVDRDPAAEERFEELAREVPCQTRFLRMRFADALELLAEEGETADIVLFDPAVRRTIRAAPPGTPAAARIARQSLGRNARAIDSCPSSRTIRCAPISRASKGKPR